MKPQPSHETASSGATLEHSVMTEITLSLCLFDVFSSLVVISVSNEVSNVASSLTALCIGLGPTDIQHFWGDVQYGLVISIPCQIKVKQLVKVKYMFLSLKYKYIFTKQKAK